MLGHFQFSHIPALFAGSAMAFGGVWPMFDAPAAMREFGFPAHVANTPAAAPVFVVGNVRTTCLGFLMLLFYARRQLTVVDTCLAVTGAYAGLVDSYVVWKQGNPRMALFRLASSAFLSAWGFLGWTAAAGP
ncbi:hypothetical protein F5B22DRAFT_50765 [Xylaria bambusicola]|uniref:uncharacterized protein n=1 Tax=Xylaria bambusicola TaxID=326684 RepID=UPI0020086E86|nr:uncharacterized protein F5B22DRAFT_50765 [Xylaria bambusicola]KAI0520764.1 hypothetical protein F5B22DRAFT_50765 [Xylaria bambusicola]